VNQAYDLAECRDSWRLGSGVLCEERSNKEMKLTKGGWRRGGAW
jgi:hypothetical protein